MLTGQTIVCFSSIDWESNWQVHQEVMTRLARAGNRIVFVENTGVRRPGLRDLPRLARRVRSWRSGQRGRPPGPGIRVLSPLALPFPYSRLAVRVNQVLLGRLLRGPLREAPAGRPIVWTFLPTPIVTRMLPALDPRLVVYHSCDDFVSSSAAAAPIAASEELLLRAADVVIATSTRLAARARQFNADVHLIPAGVAFERFERVREGGAPLPDELRRLQRPIVGYVGAINRRMDMELVAEVAGRLPEASIVLVGPVEEPVPALERCPNVHLLGPRPHDDVPRFVIGFDVAVIPFRLTTYTHHIYPVKLNEYLAMGVPVVATPLEEVRHFADRHGDVIAVASDATQFVAAIRRAMDASADPAERRTRVEVARLNSWERRLEAISRAVEDRLS